ncbi:hypothetical protein BGX31_010346 [Mortierella sp. GBA43]|nr:hypothetical protein BGX31_010346 [Mortierella sp. GBA43]
MSAAQVSAGASTAAAVAAEAAPLRHLIRDPISQQQFRTRYLISTRSTNYATHANNKAVPNPEPIEKPPTTIQPSQIQPPEAMSNSDATLNENIKSIEQLISELNPDSATRNSKTSPEESIDPSSSTTSPMDAASQEGVFEDGSRSKTTAGAEEEAASGSATPKKPSRFWTILYHILYWSALGSIPVQLLLIKGETKDVKEKQEWKIGVLTDMRDKLQRGESVEEEEALLGIGVRRLSRKEESVDDKYFEDLLISAEKLDFMFGKDKDASNAETNDSMAPSPSLPVAAAAPAPAPSPVNTTPRKPPPPKTESSFL